VGRIRITTVEEVRLPHLTKFVAGWSETVGSEESGGEGGTSSGEEDGGEESGGEEDWREGTAEKGEGT